jgi:restriction endonuclease S subunit
MSLVINAAIDLLRREPPGLVAATGLFFRSMQNMYPQHKVSELLKLKRNGIWGNETFPGAGYPVLRSTNMRGARVDTRDPAWCEIDDEKADNYKLQDGDILVTKSSGSTDLVGKACLFERPGNDTPYLFSNFTLLLRPQSQRVLPAYLAWFLRSPQALSWRYSSQLNAVGLRNLQTDDYLSQLIPVPPSGVQEAVVQFLDSLEAGNPIWVETHLPEPLTEQRRIVARIEELAVKIAEAKGLREEADQETGFLIRNARESEFRHLFKTIPCSRLGQVTETRLGKMLSAAVKMGVSPAPYLRNANIYNDHIDLSSVFEMDFVEGEKEVFALQPGDILINEGGYGVGRCAVWEGQIRPCYFQKSLHRIRVDCSRIQPRFLMHQLIWANEQGLFDDITKATTFQHLTGVRLKQHPLFIPPIAQQSIILHRLDALSKATDPARTTQRELASDLDALLPSILDKAFRGEL